MKKILFALLAVAAFAACSDDDETPVPPQDDQTQNPPQDDETDKPDEPSQGDDTEDPAQGERVSFEAAEGLTDVYGEAVVPGPIDLYTSGVVAYSKEHVFWPKPYATEYDDYDQLYWQGPYICALDGTVMLGGYYDDGTIWDYADGEKVTDTWGGFVLSQHADMTAEKSDYTSQFDVWAASGANETKTFAVGFDSNTAGAGYLEAKEYNAPQIDFARPVAPNRVFIANSTYVYTYFTGKDSDSFVVEITGWLEGVEGNKVEVKLVDGRTKVADWTMVDLSSLGSVDKLTFKTVASEVYAPCYFCLDDLYFN